MLTIYKYPLHEVTDRPVVEMPKGAHVLSFQTQGEVPCIWALVDNEQPLEERGFYLVGTGHPFAYKPTSMRFIGTTQLMGGRLIFHLFEPVGL